MVFQLNPCRRDWPHPPACSHLVFAYVMSRQEHEVTGYTVSSGFLGPAKSRDQDRSPFYKHKRCVQETPRLMSSFYMRRKRQRTRQPSEIVSSDRSSSFCDIHSHTMSESGRYMITGRKQLKRQQNRTEHQKSRE